MRRALARAGAGGRGAGGGRGGKPERERERGEGRTGEGITREATHWPLTGRTDADWGRLSLVNDRQATQM